MPHRTRSTRQLPPRGQQQTAIHSFASAIKPGAAAVPAPLDGKKTKSTSLPVSPSKKRKLNEADTSDPTTVVEEAASAAAATVAATPSKTLRLNELTLSASRSCRDFGAKLETPNPPSPTRTRKQPRASLPLLSPCRQESRNTTTSVRVRPESSLYSAANVKVVTQTSTSTARPASFNDLLNLHSSVLKALSLHAAHNGRASPADLREFSRSVERIWKKRKVVTKDLQRLLWVWTQAQDQDQDGVAWPTMGLGYRIANYGLGRICLERDVRSGDGQDGFCYDDNELQERFEEILELLWVKHQAVVVENEREEAEDDYRPDQDRVDFVECLGLAPISESLTPFTSFRKGQQRLQDLKGGVIRAKLEKVRAQTEDQTSSTPVEATVTRKNSLLDRLKNKKLQQSKLPQPPSKEMLLRRAAAQRVEEVVGILALLRPTAARGSNAEISQAVQRKPFSLDTIVQHIRDSIRNPIPRDEVETCLEILAQTDVAGHWVGMVTVNQMKSIVLKSCENISPKEIGQRVYEMKIGYEESAL